MNYKPDPMPFSGTQLDFMELGREPKAIKAHLDNPDAKALLFFKGKPALDNNLNLITAHPQKLIETLGEESLHDPGLLFLGLRGTSPIFAVNLKEDDLRGLEPRLLPESFQEIRMIASHMNMDDLAIIGRARSFLDWHFNHNFCAKCGAKSRAEQSGLMRECPACETEHYPRVNPVVIMMVTHGDHCLLGAGHNFPDGAFSALAGFVSPGETPEDAVKREVMEEGDLRVADPAYIFSQTWPFPSQLMMGFSCEAADREIKIDMKELRDARWFSKETVEHVFAKKSDAFLRPPRFTIAHHLLRHWLSKQG